MCCAISHVYGVPAEWVLSIIETPLRITSCFIVLTSFSATKLETLTHNFIHSFFSFSSFFSCPAQTTISLHTRSAHTHAQIHTQSHLAIITMAETKVRTDVILAINDPYMQQIIDGTKTFEFRKYDMPGVQRIWFYRTAPHSAITHVCEVEPAVNRQQDHTALPEDGLGNLEYNKNHPDWDRYDFAYQINSVYAVNSPVGIPLADMKDKHGMEIAPRGRVFLPASIGQQFPLEAQTKLR